MASAPANTPANGNTTAATTTTTTTNSNNGGRVYFKIPQSVDIETANQKKRRTKSYVQRDKADVTKLDDGTLKEVFSYLQGHDLICLALTKKSIAHKVLGLARPFVDDNPTVIELDLVSDKARIFDCYAQYNTVRSFPFAFVSKKPLPRRLSYLSTRKQLMVQLNSWMPRKPASRFCWICNKYTKVNAIESTDCYGRVSTTQWHFLSSHFFRVLYTLVPECQTHTLHGIYPENVYCHARCGDLKALRTFAETTPGVSLDAYFGDNDGPPNGVAIGTVKRCRGRCLGNQPYNVHIPV